MTTYARIVDGFAIDVYPAESAQVLEERLGVTGFVVVPDGTVSGSKQNGQGGFDAPASSPTPESTPQSLSLIAFITLCQDAGGMTDDQLVACNEDARLKAMWIKFNAASVIERDDPRVVQGLGALEQLGYLPKGAAAVTAAWPKN